MDHRKYDQNLIFQSRFSCWICELAEWLMALKWRLRSPLSFCLIVWYVFSIFSRPFLFSNIVSFSKTGGSSKIWSKCHFSRSIFLLILRVGEAVIGTIMEFQISSVFLPHSLACFLDFFSIIFFLEHSEFLKKRRILEKMIKISFFTVVFIVDSESWWTC